MKILTLIAARIGSVSIKKKNLQKINNLPLLVRAAKKIEKSRHKLDLYVSTESDLIISTCKKYKLNYIKRPRSLSKHKKTKKYLKTIFFFFLKRVKIS